MVIFFSILLGLLGLNAILLIFSVNRANSGISKNKNAVSKTPITKIYPIDLLPSNYKKAI
ncbi:hypothetical protein GGR42_002994 [Saonia flava]|uniref:Uncharacterized protein n=1 Tax=Saonia flava TaxID=523696 RepID=A0A846R249_9FLAO|nr:hypothetical protein [Saonia flava]